MPDFSVRNDDAAKALFDAYYNEDIDPRMIALSASNSLSGIWDVNFVTKKTTWCSRLKTMFGLFPNTVPDSGSLYKIMHPDDLESIQKILLRHQKIDDPFEFECRIMRPCDQKVIWVHSTGRTLLDENGKAIRMVGSIMDITYLKHAEEAAKRSDKAKSNFLANMSHEIRTPMNGVLGMAELLKSADLAPREKSLVDIIERSGNALITIINDILDFSKIEAGQMELERRPFQLREAIEDVIALLSNTASESGVDLLLKMQPHLPLTYVGDVGRIRQILTNIIGNAVKFTSEGHILIDVSGDTTDDQANLTIKIEDTGVGIPEDKIEHIFNQFAQVDETTTRKFGGTGLGLSISKNLIELMNGDISVTSVEGQGSTFILSVSLPIREDFKPQQTNQYDLKGTTILIVDDNEINREILKTQLTEWGCRCVAAPSVHVAIEVLKRAHEKNIPIDLAIVDFHMPKLNGEDFVRHIEAIKTFSEIPLIILSSVDDSALRARMKEHNIAEFLTKPVRSSLLSDTIKTALNNAKHKEIKSPRKDVVKPLASISPSIKHSETIQNQSEIDVLIAEDNDVNQLYCKYVMEQLGLSFKIVPNGRAAVYKWKLLSPKIILMDISMPEMNGYDAARAIRDLETRDQLAHTPIIAVTAHVLNDTQDLCLESGMDGYLSKPLAIERLKKCLVKWNVIPNQSANLQTANMTAK